MTAAERLDDRDSWISYTPLLPSVLSCSQCLWLILHTGVHLAECCHVFSVLLTFDRISALSSSCRWRYARCRQVCWPL